MHHLCTGGAHWKIPVMNLKREQASLGSGIFPVTVTLSSASKAIEHVVSSTTNTCN